MKALRTIVAITYLFLANPSDAAWIATSSPESTDAAASVLGQGGNAIDAACAAFFVQSVTQSYFTGLGGGGFATLEANGKVQHYDFRESAPASVDENLYAGIDLKSPSAWKLRNTGGLSVGVPGNIAGCALMVKLHGKKTWKEVIAPALEFANSGFSISKMYEEELAEQWNRIQSFEPTRSILKGNDGNGLKKGEVLKQPELGLMLQRLRDEGADSFYTGKLADSWVEEAKKLGSKITKHDLSQYKVAQKKPIHFEFGDFSGETAAPSSSAGLMVGAVLRFLDHYHTKKSSLTKSSVEQKIVEIETLLHFGLLRKKVVSDPIRNKIDFARWYGSKTEMDSWRELETKISERISKLGLNPSAKATLGRPSSLPSKETSHTSNISVIDDYGNAIALTSSMGNIFGSGITVPKYGFLLNSSLGDFTPALSDINAPGGGYRPRSDISPTLIYQKTKKRRTLVGVIGAAGGPLIPQSIVQFFLNYFVYGMNGAEAIRSPRVSVSSNDGSVEIEKNASAELYESLKKVGYEISQTDTIWAVLNGIVRKGPDSKWEAISESRYDGKAWSSSK